MVLLTPGPTPVPQPVREAMARPIIHHRTPEFEALMRGVSEKLQRVFRTENPVLTIPGSGTAACEAALLSLVRPRDIVVTFANGKFGARWAQVFSRLGGEIVIDDIPIESPWGKAIPIDNIERLLDSFVGRRATMFTLVHTETSAATTNDLRAIATLIRERRPDAVIVADCITSIGAIPVEPDDWGVDVAVCASQKSLRNAPGLGFVSVSQRARERLAESGRLAPLYLSLGAYLKGHEQGRLPYTAPVSLIQAQDVALDLILEEGLDTALRRTASLAAATRDALTAMGLPLASAAPADSVTAARMPEGAPDGLADEVRAFCKESEGVHIAGGQGEWAGQVIRISHMGAVTAEDTVAGVRAVAHALKRLGPVKGADPDAGLSVIRDRLGADAASESMTGVSA